MTILIILILPKIKNIQLIHKNQKEENTSTYKRKPIRAQKEKRKERNKEEIQNQLENKVKMSIKIYLSIITLNVKGLNAPIKRHRVGFPGGTVVGSLPANAGDTGSSPGPGRSHMPWSNWAHAPQLLSLRSRARKAQLLSLCATPTEARVPRAHAPQQEKPPQ